MSIRNRASLPWHGVAVGLILGALLPGAPLDGQVRSGPLLIGTGAGYAPFVSELPTGEYEGLSFDMASEIARRIGRPGIQRVPLNRADLFDALLARDFEMTGSPTNITPDRARRVLFSEGFMDTGLSFLVFQGAELRDIADLRGKTLAVGAGSVSDTWGTLNEAWLGFSVQRYSDTGDALSAVINRRAFASLSDLPRATHTANELKIVHVAYSIPISGAFGLAFHPDDVGLRKEVENALECMKLDGTLAALHEKWFGFRAEEGTAINTVYAGYGDPRVNGYDPQAHVPRCS